jgi:AraC-like DNA-binding protein
VASSAALTVDAGGGANEAQSPLFDRRVSFAIVDDTDGYESSVHGIRVRSMRTGRGLGPNRVFAASADDFVATSVDVGFPMLNRSSMADDRVAVAYIRSAPGGARWSGIDLRPGTVVMYGPGAQHFGINPAGLSFEFAVIELGVLEELADSLGHRFRPPPRGSVSALAPFPHATAFGGELSLFLQAAAAGTTAQANRQDDVLYRVSAALSDDRPSRSVAGTRKIDRRRVIRTCIYYAEAIGRAPSIKELCLVAHVSERLLRVAFVEESGMPPTAFFRVWAVNESRRLLRTAHPRHDTVTDVAVSVGIRHLGRFARHYREAFGELPSETLASS